MSAETPFWLFLCRQGPYGSAWGAACLELLMTAAAFDRRVVLAFTGDGVHYLLAGQDSAGLGLKDLSRSLPALELYEVKEVVAEAAALEARGIRKDDLVIPAEPLDAEALGGLMARAAQVFVF